MNPISEKSYDFIINFEKSLNYFGEKVKLLPLYKFKNLKDGYDGNDFRNNDFRENHCYGRGEFCDLNVFNLDSFSVLNEGLRQICIFENNKDYWWEYIFQYQTCLNQKLKTKSKKKKILDCHKTILISRSEDFKNEIEDCIKESFSNPENKWLSTNDLLEDHKNPFFYQNVYLVPAIFIDDRLVKEELMNKIVISAICEKLTEAPKFCKNLHNFNQVFKNKTNYSDKKKDLFWWIFLPVLFFGFFLVFFLIFFCRKKFKKNIDEEVNIEIRDYVSKYMRLS